MGAPPDGSLLDDLRPLLPIAALALGIALTPPVPSVSVRAALAALALIAAIACARLPRTPRFRRAAAAPCLGLALYLAGGLASDEEQRRLAAPLRALPRALDLSAEEGRIVRVEGRFEADPESSDDRLGAVLEVESLEDAGVRASFRSRVFVSWPAPEERTPPMLLAGRRVRLTARLRLPRSFGNPGAFDFAAHLARRDIVATGFVKSARLIEILHEDEEERSARTWVRRRFDRIFLRLFGGPDGRLSVEGSVLRASVLGGRTGLAPASERSLVASGVYHVLAVSGLQIAVLAGAVLLILLRMPLPTWTALVIAVLMAAFYGEVVAPSASVRRAVVMAGLAALARLLHRRPRPLVLLAATALGILCLRPSELADPGFQLTFSATAGILLFSHRLASHLPARWGLSSLLAVSLAAQGATWPLVASWFHRVVPYGLASNLLAVPLGSAAVVLGILLLPADLVSEPLSGAVGLLAALAVKGLLAVAGVPVEGTPLSFRISEPTRCALAAAFGALLVLAVSRRSRTIAAGGALLAGAFLLIVADPLPREPMTSIPHLAEQGRKTPGLLAIDVLDVGQGDAILIGFPDGEIMLVDGGGFPGSSFDIGERVLVPELERRGLRRIGRVVLTHAHEDHGGGLREVLRDLSVGELLSPDAPEGRLRDELEGIARKRGTRTVRIRRGYLIREGDTIIECLSPFPGGMEDPNADSVVLRVSHGARSAVLTGDIGAATERRLVTEGLAPADFLKVAHHGSAGSTTLAMLSALNPRVAVISVGASNRFGHPSSDTLRRLSAARGLVLRTDRDGAVRVGVAGEALFAGSLQKERPLAYPGPALRPRPPPPLTTRR